MRPMMDNTRNNIKKVGKTFPKKVTFKRVLGEPSKGRLEDKTGMAACSVDGDVTMRSIKGNRKLNFESITNNSKAIGTVPPEIVETIPVQEKILNGASKSDMEVAACSRNGEEVEFDSDEDVESEFMILENYSKHTITAFPKVVSIQLTPSKPVTESAGDKTKVISCNVNDKMTLFRFRDSYVPEFKENSSIFVYSGVGMNRENEDESSSAGGSVCGINRENEDESSSAGGSICGINRENEDKSSSAGGSVCDSAALETQKPVQPVELEKDVGNIKQENKGDDQTICSNGDESSRGVCTEIIDATNKMKSGTDEIKSGTDEIKSGTDEIKSGIHQDSKIKLPDVSVQVEDLFPSHLRKLGKAHSNMGFCACIYCCGEYTHNSDSQQLSENLESSMLIQGPNDNLKESEENEQSSGSKTPPKGQNHRCRFCFVEFKRMSALYHHLKEHNVNKPFKCGQCPARFWERCHLRTHLRRHSNVRPFECELCPATFKFAGHLKDHKKVHNDERPFECNLCSAKFKVLSHLNAHKRVHNDERSFECELCPAKYKSLGSLNKHQSVHNDERPFKCDLCPAKFRLENYLNNHKRVHSDEKPFECKLCPSKFKFSSHLHAHQKVHSDERPFECKLCPAKFKSLAQLKTHQTVHNDERPFKCKICRTEFKHCLSLKRHLLAHTGEKSFKCEFCPAKFLNRCDLSAHMKIHTFGNPFVCGLCPSTFKHKSTLGRHLKLYHIKA